MNDVIFTLEDLFLLYKFGICAICKNGNVAYFEYEEIS